MFDWSFYDDFAVYLQNSAQLRSGLMVLLAVSVALPLGLRRNVESLSHFSALSIGFYIAFIIYVRIPVELDFKPLV